MRNQVIMALTAQDSDSPELMYRLTTRDKTYEIMSNGFVNQAPAPWTLPMPEDTCLIYNRFDAALRQAAAQERERCIRVVESYVGSSGACFPKCAHELRNDAAPESMAFYEEEFEKRKNNP